VLLETLARDLKTRAEAAPGTLVDNEVLEGGRYAELLDEIRACLARQESETAAASFRRLATALSAPALALLLLLGGAATIGCDRAGLKSAPRTPDAAVLADASPAQTPDGKGDTSTAAPLPEAGGPHISLDALRATPPDARPPGPDAATSGPDGAAVTIQEIMESCNLPSQDQAAVLACLAGLRESWRSGMAEVLAGAPCTSVQAELTCFAYASSACMFRSADDFVAGATRICDPILIYLGVRFI